MENKNKNLLTAIIPLTSKLDRVQNVIEILKLAGKLPITIILVFDSEESIPAALTKVINERPVETIITQGFWKNPGESRNAGLDKLSTEWVTFWDSDDSPLPAAVLKMVEMAQIRDAEFCIGGFEIEFVGEKLNQKFIPTGENWSHSTFLYPGLWRFAFRTSALNEAKFGRYSMGEDQDFLARAISRLSRIFVMNEIVYKYRMTTTDQLTKTFKNFSELVEIFDNLHTLLKPMNSETAQTIGVMKAKIAATSIIRGTFKIKMMIILKLLLRLGHPKSLSRENVGHGLAISLREKFKVSTF